MSRSTAAHQAWRDPHLPQLSPWTSWKSWDTLAVDLLNIPKEVNTHDIYDGFGKEGNIMHIDLWENLKGEPDSKGRIRFRPPPEKAFWANGPYRIRLRSGVYYDLFLKLSDSHPHTIPSPVRPAVQLPIEIELNTTQVDIGVLLNESTVHFMQSFPGSSHPRFVVNVKLKCLFIYLKVGIRGSDKSELIQQDYRIKITFLQLSEVFEQADQKQTSLFIILDSAVICHRKVNNIQFTFTEPRSWREEDAWYRQTSVAHNPSFLRNVPTNLKKSGQVIDLGRWNVFKITLAPEPTTDPKLYTNYTRPLIRMREIFKDYNITVKIGSHFTESPHRPVPVWQWIDFSESGSQRNSALLQDLGNETYEHLPFEVRYQLEVCLSQGYLSEYTMTRDFIRELKARGDVQGRRLLEFVATEKRKYLDPMRIFDFQFLKGVTDSKIPSYCCYMHTARVTPTTIYYNTPSVDISNRVVRGWSSNHSAGRFLRVRFTDEKTEGRINSSIGNSNDEVYTRVKRTLANGITIGSRHYEFLAFGNSQFREHGAYFFSSDAGVSAATIRAWMGQFNHIRNVAKYAARLGQSFSTTRAFTSSSVQAVVRNDIGRNGFTFSDGVGKISKFLAQLITEEHKIRTSTGDPPSAYQFRLGGSKGILVVSPDPLPKEVHIRPSQYKFEAKHQGLEIIRWSQFSLATLNRQLILVLTALGIPDHVFHAKQNAMLNSFYEAMSSDAKVTELLQKYIDPSQTTLILAKMVNDGFRRANEPFMNTMLGLWKAWHLKHLKEKAKIVIDGGANLLGCIDETATLKGYFKNTIPANGSYEEKLAALPEIFVQVCRPEADGRYEIIKGVCILARNPSLHPGDIRVVRAVDRPELRDLRDVVVLPQTGDQDVASMCSGGDLDGDDYLVIWDPDLIPTDWFTESMDYKSNKAPDLNHDVTVDEVTSFFVTYMKNDCLPKIAHAHMAWADRLTDGVRSEKCMRLAKLHSDAVDYNKTGGHAVMRRDLTPTLWPHFMEKRFKRKECIYHSRRILGQLYDNVIAPDFVPNLAMPFDSRILNGSLAAASELYMNFARALKVEWDMNMRQVMAQYEISTEFEVWSTFVLRHGFVLKDFKMQEDLGNIVGNMRRGFRQACYDKAGADHIASLVVAMYRVTEEQMTAAIEAQKEEKRLREDLSIVDIPSTELPFITFPWIFPEVLGEIAMGKRQASGAGTSGVHDPSSTEKKPIFDWTQVQKIVEGMQDNVTTKLIVDQVSDSTMLNEEIGSGHRHKSSEDRDSGVWLDEDDNEDDEDGGVRLTSNDKDEDFSFEPVEPVGPVADEKMEIKEKIAGDDGLDIVEKEGDVKPSALDTLISMINT